MSILNSRSSAGAFYGALVAFSVAMVISMIYAIESGRLVQEEHVPNVRAAGRIKLDTSLAHLWFEESLSGDRNESIGEVWQLLDSAQFYVRAMIHGAVDEQGRIMPLDDPDLQSRIREVDRVLGEFRSITRARQMAQHSAVPGTAIDQQYDAVFLNLIELAGNVEFRLREVIQAESKFVRNIQIAVMVGAAILSVLVALTFRRYTKERAEAEKALEQKIQAEADSRKLLERLAHVSRLNTMNELAAGIAHEVNQPLTAIMMTAAAYRHLGNSGGDDFDSVQEAMATIGTQAERAGNVIRRLRSFVTKEEVKYIPSNLNFLVKTVVKLAKLDPQVIDSDIRLELDEDLPMVDVDEIQIQQVLLNLIRNAVEATAETGQEGRPIRVVTRKGKGGDIEVSVSDEGIGLPDSIESRLFQPFMTTKESGMGMGLSISESIVRAHGGRIWFERNPHGPGSTFTFSLPRVSGSKSV